MSLIITWIGAQLGSVLRTLKQHLGLVVAYLFMAFAAGIGISAVSDAVDKIDQASFEASRRICNLAVATREDSRREDNQQLKRAKNFQLPSPSELGIYDITPGATQYIDQLADSVNATQIAYYEARLEEFPPLKCVTIHNRRVAVPQ